MVWGGGGVGPDPCLGKTLCFELGIAQIKFKKRKYMVEFYISGDYHFEHGGP
jgi:hypothetical protein